ncbi:hypothetical protein ABB37_07406 [Leptomonas pyrrhocoris]|uniref:Uncharacterized protein n=1 Tax=Leptomonas pyrrhocoris TaxID=157538 RepID=A0A0M9FW27_LEPPY|nr:hypothetical protein ABB37_07406 [Leptomonas pyrrhocoris]KPA77076.1 hypothetical protein ABB37_07406 [Leptomonas pyrrhocoris]|eukprot:XP_015655515.1 hypothetical protein ABB37_07406 [Leptomonas pyrrhocoris]
MFTSRSFAARDTELQSALTALHKAHYHTHEDVVGILLADDFRADAMRGEYYTTTYLRHRLPLLFSLALCKWRPHRHMRTQLLQKKDRLHSSDNLVQRGDAPRDSEEDSEDAQHQRRHRRDGGSYGLRSDDGADSSLSPAGAVDRSKSLLHRDASMSDDSQRETWSAEHTPAPSTPSPPPATAAAAKGNGGLTHEQQTQLSILALQLLCGDRSRVREGSAEAFTAVCGPIWDARTVRAFYDDHRRLVRWTCRVLHASCEWMEIVVRRAVEDELLEAPASVSAPNPHVHDVSSGVVPGCGDSADAVAAPLMSTSSSSPRRSREHRAVSVGARRLPSCTVYSPRKEASSANPISLDGRQPASSTSSNDSGSDTQDGTPHFRRLRRLRSEPPLMTTLPPRVPQRSGSNTLLHPQSEQVSCGQNTPPPPPPPPPIASSVTPPSSTPKHNYRTTFASTAELEASLELHCRRIRHALMLLESLLVSLVLVQSYIYRTEPGRSNMPPWLRPDGSSNSSSGSASSESSGIDDSLSDRDDDCDGGRREDVSEDGSIDGGGHRRRVQTGSLLESAIDSRRRLRRQRRQRQRSQTTVSIKDRSSPFELRTDTCSSFGTIRGAGEEVVDAQIAAEAKEPPLGLLVRHSLHAFTETFLCITTVQQQLQEYSHESRHAPVSTTTVLPNRSFTVASAMTTSSENTNNDNNNNSSNTSRLSSHNLLRYPSPPYLLPSYTATTTAGSAVSPVTPVESESETLVAARGTPAAYACPTCQRFHQVEEMLLVAANTNLEVLKKTAIAFAANHSAIAAESIRVIDAEGAVFTSQATMLLAHVLTPDLLAAHPPGSRGGMALEWVLNYVFGGCSGADVRQHQQQQERQHVAGVADANSSFDCFSLVNSSFSSTNPQSTDASDPDGHSLSSDGGWRSLGGENSNASDGGHSSAPSSGKWNVNRFEYGDNDVGDAPLQRNDTTTNLSDGAAPPETAPEPQETRATNMRVEYVLAACFTRCHPLMTVIGLVAENNQYNCGHTVAQAVLQYAFTLAQTSALLLRTPLLTNSWSTPFIEAMMRGLSELAAHAHQSVSVTPAVAQPAGALGGGGGGGAGGVTSGAAAAGANLTWSFSSSSPAAAVAAAVAGRAAAAPTGPPQLMGPDRSFAPLLAAHLNVPTSLVSSAMQHVPRPRPYAFTPPPTIVVTGATAAEESEVAQVRTMRRCLALHWAKCVLLSARTLTRAGTYDVAVPFEHYVNIRNARVRLRGRMMEYRDRMRSHFAHGANHEKVRRLDEVFARWEADERRMAMNDVTITEDPNGSFTTATAPFTTQGTPTTPALYAVDSFGRVSPMPVTVGEGGTMSDPQTAVGSAVPSHFNSARNSYTMTSPFAVSTGPNSKTWTPVAATTATTAPAPAADPIRDQLLLPQPDDSDPGSIGADPLGRSFDDTSGTVVTEKESYRRAFVDSFCFGKSDFELLSAALLDKSRTAVQVPIHVIVCTSLFSVLDAMGDVLLCEKPRLNSVVANELLTLLYEAQLSMLEPLHDGAMAVVERTGSTPSSTAATTPSFSLCSSPEMEHPGADVKDAATSDSFVSPTSIRLPSTAATSSSPSNASSRSSSSSSCVSSASSVTLSSDGSTSQPAPAPPAPADTERENAVSGPPHRGGDGEGGSDNQPDSVPSLHAGPAQQHHPKKKHTKREDSTAITRDGHILLFNEYALLLEAGLRTPLVVRRWRDDVKRNPDHAARGYLSLLDHLQYRQSQWAEASREEYLVSRSTLRLMLGVTARDARGNLHGNILHVDDLDVMGSRKEEVAPRLGVTSSKDSLTTLYSDEWDPSMVEPAVTAQAHKVDGRDGSSSGDAVAVAAAASSESINSGSNPAMCSQGPSVDSMGHDHSGDGLAESKRQEGGSATTARSRAVEALSALPLLRSTDHFSGEAFKPPSRVLVAPGIAAPPSPSGVPGVTCSSSAHLTPPGLLGRPPLQGTAVKLGPRTSSFECVSLLGTRMETSDEGTPLQASSSSAAAGNSSIAHAHHRHHIPHYVDADNLEDDDDGDDDLEGVEEGTEDLDDVARDRLHHRHHHEGAHAGDDAHHCAVCASEGLANFSFASAETSDEEREGRASPPSASASHVTAPQSIEQQRHSSHLPRHDGADGTDNCHHALHHLHPQQQHSSGVDSVSRASRSPSHLHSGNGSDDRANHRRHLRPSHPSWRLMPTRVTLAGVRAELDTMRTRMPDTWTLTEPLAEEGNAPSAAAAAAAVAAEKQKEINGGLAEEHRSAAAAGPTAAAPSAVLYAPVRVTPVNPNSISNNTDATTAEQVELKAPAANTGSDSAPSSVQPPTSGEARAGRGATHGDGDVVGGSAGEGPPPPLSPAEATVPSSALPASVVAAAEEPKVKTVQGDATAAAAGALTGVLSATTEEEAAACACAEEVPATREPVPGNAADVPLARAAREDEGKVGKVAGENKTEVFSALSSPPQLPAEPESIVAVEEAVQPVEASPLLAGCLHSSNTSSGSRSNSTMESPRSAPEELRTTENAGEGAEVGSVNSGAAVPCDDAAPADADVTHRGGSCGPASPVASQQGLPGSTLAMTPPSASSKVILMELPTTKATAVFGSSRRAASVGGCGFTGSPFSSPRLFVDAMGSSAPLGTSSGGLLSDAALNRAMHRVLHHHRALPLGTSPSSLRSTYHASARSTPCSPPSPPSAAAATVAEEADGRGSNGASSLRGGSPIPGERGKEPDPLPTAHARKEKPRHQSLSTRDIWNQTLSQLKLTTTAAAEGSSQEVGEERVAPQRLSLDAASTPTDAEGAGAASMTNHAAMTVLPDSTDNLRHSSSSSSVGDHVEVSSSAMALLGQASTGTVSPTSPNTSHSAPHDLQWYTRANTAAAHRPPRSTVSVEEPMSPASVDNSRFSVEGSSTAQVAAEGVMGGIPIGQGGGRSRLWPAGARSRQRSPPSERLNGGVQVSADAADPSNAQGSRGITSVTKSDSCDLCAPSTSTAAAVPSVMQRTSASDGGGVSDVVKKRREAQTPPPPCAMLNGKSLTDVERAYEPLVHHVPLRLNNHSDSPLNNRNVAATDYASGNDSDVST